MAIYKFRKKCRLCSSTKFNLVLDLGKQPPSNAFLTKNQLKKVEKKFPLRLYICKKCFHLQLRDVVDKKYLFSHYLYLSGANKPIIEHFEKYANSVYKKILKQKINPYLIEIGSNDGTLLEKFLKFDVDVLGIEPAKNLAKISSKKIKVENKFFSKKLAKKIAEKRKADVIIANNVLGHIDDLDDFINGILKLLKNDGVFIFEVPHALDLLKKLEFDTIYHEHISYFTVFSLMKWFKNNNLEIFNIEKQKVHGGTLRIYVAKKNTHEIRKSVNNFKNQEIKFGINKLKTYESFSNKINKLKISLIKKIIKLKNEQNKIFGYGAPAKGNVLLNYCQINNKMLDFITDTTSIKQGKYTPGTHIIVKSPKIISKFSKQYVGLILAWNYKHDILQKEKKFLDDGGKFLIPVPRPVLVSTNNKKY
tara:strand:- start:1266 stop:2525 length:1260 start_codon:yes stop_codon:yes gene_type:complete